MRRLLVWMAVGLLGCAGETERSDGVTATSAARIIGGVASSSEQDAVVAIAIRSNGSLRGICSGTAVAPNLVLTARHCVASTDDHALCSADGVAIAGGAVFEDHSPTDLQVYRGAKAIHTLAVDAIGANPSAQGKALIVEGSTLCNADLAFLVLDRNLPPPYAPIRAVALPAVGESLTAVGYGLTEAGTLPEWRQTRSEITVRAVGRLAYSGGSGLGNAELLVSESSCSGDSGGPLLSPTTGAVVGVVSRGGGGTGPPGNTAAGCIGPSARSIYTHLAPKQSLVTRAYDAAGRMAWYEGEPTPYVAMGGCSADHDCTSGVCSMATRTCVAPASLPTSPVPVDAGSEASAPSSEAVGDGGAASGSQTSTSVPIRANVSSDTTVDETVTPSSPAESSPFTSTSSIACAIQPSQGRASRHDDVVLFSALSIGAAAFLRSRTGVARRRLKRR